MKSILEFSSEEAKTFFLKEKSYCKFELPSYFSFRNILDLCEAKLAGKRLSDFYESGCKPFDYENVNYRFLTNKDGKYAWRPFQLIHPAVYVSLVNCISNDDSWNVIMSRFQEFALDEKITCYSLPLEGKEDTPDQAASIKNWWNSVEQQSIELALSYEYIAHADISDCYGSLYTHSIPWALHTKETAKQERKNKHLIGNVIDSHLQDMSYGQTNGIPQGSVLSDFIAEMVLGFCDQILSEKLNGEVQDCRIIRYRDDYRIFTNNPNDSDLILRYLSETLADLGMRFNPSKMLASGNVITDSLKPDKIFWLASRRSNSGFQKHLFLIHQLAEKFPNSGQLVTALNHFFDRLAGFETAYSNIPVLVSILVDICLKNPRVYPIATAIMSKLFSFLDSDERRAELLTLILKKFEKVPNTGHLLVWIQRLTIKFDREKSYGELLCKKVNDSTIPIWDSRWISEGFRNQLDSTSIVDESRITEMDIVIQPQEVKLFDSTQDFSN